MRDAASKKLVNFGGEIAGLTLVVISHNKTIERVRERDDEEWVPGSSAHSHDGSHLTTILCLSLLACLVAFLLISGENQASC